MKLIKEKIIKQTDIQKNFKKWKTMHNLKEVSLTLHFNFDQTYY